jgi:hypothetical protein
MTRKPPPVIHGSRVLQYAVVGAIAFVGKTSVFVDNWEVGPVPHLIIAQSLRADGFELGYCDASWQTVGSAGGLRSVGEAKRRAERNYPGIRGAWKATRVSKADALAYERNLWRGHECNFCGRIPPEFDAWISQRKAVICNLCIREFHADLTETSPNAV